MRGEAFGALFQEAWCCFSSSGGSSLLAVLTQCALNPQAAAGGDSSVPGLLLKYLVGGGGGGAVVDDVAEGEEAQARRMGFCHYLNSRSLSIDVFDGDSLLQVGTLAVDLQALLRQGREFAEVNEISSD
jgi:hypothetical protein